MALGLSMNLLHLSMALSTKNSTSIEIDELLNNRLDNCAIVDVRSPSEYLHDHIPTSINVPLLMMRNGQLWGQHTRQMGLSKQSYAHYI